MYFERLPRVANTERLPEPLHSELLREQEGRYDAVMRVSTHELQSPSLVEVCEDRRYDALTARCNAAS